MNDMSTRLPDDPIQTNARRQRVPTPYGRCVAAAAQKEKLKKLHARLSQTFAANHRLSLIASHPSSSSSSVLYIAILVMPGHVNLHVWHHLPGASIEDSFRLVQQRRVVVFGATPGLGWGGFQSFVKSLSYEYTTPTIQYYEKDPSIGESQERPPDPQCPSLLATPQQEFIFPKQGTISLVIILPSGSSNKSPSAELMRSTSAS